MKHGNIKDCFRRFRKPHQLCRSIFCLSAVLAPNQSLSFPHLYSKFSFQPSAAITGRSTFPRTLHAEGTEPSPDAGIAAKGVWFAAELAGKASKVFRSPSTPVRADGPDRPPLDVQEAIQRLMADYEGPDGPYFLTGSMDTALYAEDCEFSDPFVSFRGRDRFVQNLENLAGGFITDADVRLLNTSISGGEPRTVTSEDVGPLVFTTRLLVKLRLQLPWNPVLAWVWGVEHVFDPCEGSEGPGLIVRHIERWEVSPADGLRQLFRPGPPNALKRRQPVAAETPEDKGDGEIMTSRLGTMDPIAGPLVKAARALGAIPEEEDDGWTGEPSAWADKDSFTQRLSAFSQARLGGTKQWLAERVAGDFDVAAADERLDLFIAASPVAMFSFTSCPFCKRAKELLDSKGIAYEVLELDENPDGAGLRARLGVRTGRTSVPSIWIGGKYIGGLNDGCPGLIPLNEAGELDFMIEEAVPSPARQWWNFRV